MPRNGEPIKTKPELQTLQETNTPEEEFISHAYLLNRKFFSEFFKDVRENGPSSIHKLKDRSGSIFYDIQRFFFGVTLHFPL